MKIARVQVKDTGEMLTGALDGGRFFPFDGDLYAAFAAGASPSAVGRAARFFGAGEFAFCAPVAPTKIVAVGLNYRGHAAEMKMPIPDEPLLFLKPPSAVIGDGYDIVIPAGAARVDYEGELAIVIGRRCAGAGIDEARRCILGYTCFNDVTERVLQKKDGQYTRAKGFDTFAPCGPWIETDIDPRALAIETRVNGVVVQRGNTADLIFGPAELVSFISGVMTLYPDDIIPTGTPSGIGPLSAGDTVAVSIDGIGVLTNRVVRHKA